MTHTVFIDGAVGTTGLEIADRLAGRSEFTLIALDEATVYAHLAGCSDCRTFAHRAEALHRTVRLAPAPAIPDLTPDILTAIGEDQWRSALDTAFLGPIALMSAVLPGMAARGFGRIVNIGTVSGKAPWDKRVLSGAPRSALLNYVHSVSKSFAGKNVTLNTLLPGMFATEAAMARFGDDPEAAMLEQARKMRIPAGRFGRPEELAQACLLLCGAQAGFITGQSLVLDGGATTSLI